jgi:hypothetical protein
MADDKKFIDEMFAKYHKNRPLTSQLPEGTLFDIGRLIGTADRMRSRVKRLEAALLEALAESSVDHAQQNNGWRRRCEEALK